METRRGTRLRVVPDVFNNVPMDFLLRSRTKPIRCTPNAISPQNGHESTNVHWSRGPVNHRAYERFIDEHSSLSLSLLKKKECLSGSVGRWYVTRNPKKSGWIRLEDVKSGSVAVQNDSSHPSPSLLPPFIRNFALRWRILKFLLLHWRSSWCDERCKSAWFDHAPPCLLRTREGWLKLEEGREGFDV